MKNNSQMREEGGGIVQYTVIGVAFHLCFKASPIVEPFI